MAPSSPSLLGLLKGHHFTVFGEGMNGLHFSVHLSSNQLRLRLWRMKGGYVVASKGQTTQMPFCCICNKGRRKSPNKANAVSSYAEYALESKITTHPTVISNMLLPTELDTAMSPRPFRATITLVMRSGIEVPAARIVKPIISSEIPMVSPTWGNNNSGQEPWQQQGGHLSVHSTATRCLTRKHLGSAHALCKTGMGCG